MDSEQLVSRMLELITEQELEERIRRKVESLGGLCDRDTAVLLIAHELGLDENTTALSKLDQHSKSVSFSAAVLSVLSVRTFSRDDGSSGMVANLLVGDESGTARVVLWDELAELVKSGKVQVGMSYVFSGSVREGRGGLEVHIGRWGNITPLSRPINPLFEPAPLSSLRAGMEVDVLARVVSLAPPRAFSRRDGTEGVMREAMLADESGCLRAVLWGQAAHMQLHRGDVLEIRRARVREGKGSPELHLDTSTPIMVSDKTIQWQPTITPLSKLEVGRMCCVQGVVSGLGDMRTFTRKDGTEGRMAEVYLSEGGVRIRLVLWDECAEIVEELDFGDAIRVLFCYVREGPELSTTRLSVVESA